MFPRPNLALLRIPRPLLVTAVSVLGCFILSLGRPVGPSTAVVLLSLAILAVLADARPMTALGVGLVAVVLVPVYAGPYIGGSLIGATPALVLTLVLLPAAGRRCARVDLVPLDWAVAAYCALRVASYLLNFDSGPGAAAGVVLYIAVPYAVFRVITLLPGSAALLARCAVGAGSVVAAFAVAERRGTPNPWFDLPANGYQAVQFARPEIRLGSIRAEASFGHPIALGMFLAFAIVLAVALALSTEHLWTRVVLLLAAGLMLAAVVDTLSRGPLLVLALAALLWFSVEVRRLSVPRTLALLACGVALLSVGSTGATLQQLTAASSGDTNESRSAAYRLVILDVVRDPEQFTLLGRQTFTGEIGVADTVSDRTGLKSFDNAFALVYLANGLLPLLSFVAIGALVLRMIGVAELGPVERAWVVSVFAAFANLVTVNLLTQYEDVFWLATALTATLWQQHRRGPTSGARSMALARSSG